MRFLSANYIYPISSAPVENGVIVLNKDGSINEIIDPKKKTVNVVPEYFDGILCPGFVNAHCHLELSHMKGRIESKRGLTGFIEEIVVKRNESKDIVLEKAKDADEEMFNEGIVAVADISNDEITIDLKNNSRIYYHTFVELFDLLPERAQSTFENGISLFEKFIQNNLKASLSPHAPYTVSERLMKLISCHARKNNGILTIHNQETKSEREMFERGTGELFDQLRKMIPSFAKWNLPSKNSLNYILDLIPSDIPLQLVHNTFTNKNDLVFAKNKTLYWCICSKANLFIENTLPDVDLLYDSGFKLTVGTDSYASNSSLSIVDELKTIQQYYPAIPLNELLKWATLNGAEFLGISDKYGSFEKGKSPGIVCADWATGKVRRIA